MSETGLKTYLNKLDNLLRNDEAEEVIHHCRHILKHYPRNAETYRLMGRALMRKARWEEAAEVFRRLLSAYPNDFTAHLSLGEAYTRLNNPNGAIWHLERAFDHRPGDQTILKRLRELYEAHRGLKLERIQLTAGAAARQYMRNDAPERAVSLLRDFLAQNQDRVDLRLLLAEALWQDSRHAEAAEAALEVLGALPYSVRANTILTELWLMYQRPSDASRFLGRLEEVEPYLAYELAGQVIEAESIPIEELDYQTVASRELASASPDWLSSVEQEHEEEVALDFDFEEEAAPVDEMPLIETAEDDEDWLADVAANVEGDEDFSMDDLFDIDDLDLEPETEAPAEAPRKKATDDLPNLLDDDWEKQLDEMQGRSMAVTAVLQLPPEMQHLFDNAPDKMAQEKPKEETKAEELEKSLPRTEARTGLTGLLRALDTDEDDWLMTAQTGQLDNIFEQQTRFADMEQVLDESLEDAESDWVDSLEPGGQESTGITDLLDTLGATRADAPDEAPSQSGAPDLFGDIQEKKAVPSSTDDDRFAWMHSSGIEISDEDEEPVELEWVDEDEETTIQSGPLDPMAWAKSTGIEITQEDAAPNFFTDDAAEEDLDSFEAPGGGLDWAQSFGIEVDNPPPTPAPTPPRQPAAKRTEETRAVQPSKPADWQSDDSALDELMDIEAMSAPDYDPSLSPAAPADEALEMDSLIWEELQDEALAEEEFEAAPGLFDDIEDTATSLDDEVTLDEIEAELEAEGFQWQDADDETSAAWGQSAETIEAMPDAAVLNEQDDAMLDDDWQDDELDDLEWLDDDEPAETPAAAVPNFFDDIEEETPPEEEEPAEWLADMDAMKSRAEDSTIAARADWLTNAIVESSDEVELDVEAEDLAQPDWLTDVGAMDHDEEIAAEADFTMDIDEVEIADFELSADEPEQEEADSEFDFVFEDSEEEEAEPEQEGIPDWLNQATPLDVDEPEEAVVGATVWDSANEPDEEDSAPAWLANAIPDEESSEEEVTAGFDWAEEIEEEVEAEAAMPDWMSQSLQIDEEQSEEEAESAFDWAEEIEEEVEAEAAMPDWMSQSLQIDEEESEEEAESAFDWAEEIEEDEIAAVEQEAAAEFDWAEEIEMEEEAEIEEEPIPDWLNQATPMDVDEMEEEAAPALEWGDEEEEESLLSIMEADELEEAPAWIADYGKQTLEGEEEDHVPSDVPDWLSGAADEIEEEAIETTGVGLLWQEEEEEGAPDWLSESAPMDEIEEEQDWEEEEDVSPTLGMTGLLQSIQSRSPYTIEEPEEAETEEADWIGDVALPTVETPEDAAMLDWMQDIEDETVPEEAEYAAPAASGIPDWLSGYDPTAETSDAQPWLSDEDEAEEAEPAYYLDEQEEDLFEEDEIVEEAWLSDVEIDAEEAEPAYYLDEQEEDLFEEDEIVEEAWLSDVEIDAEGAEPAYYLDEQEEDAEPAYMQNGEERFAEDEYYEELEEAEVANAPDWLNAMVPGISVEYEALEEEALEEAYLEEEAVAAPTQQFQWLTDIVQTENRPGMMPAVPPPPPPSLPSVPSAPAAPRRAGRFNFTRPPAWLKRKSAQPEEAKPAATASWMDDFDDE